MVMLNKSLLNKYELIKRGGGREGFCPWFLKLVGGASRWQNGDLESSFQGPSFLWALPLIFLFVSLDIQCLPTAWDLSLEEIG